MRTHAVHNFSSFFNHDNCNEPSYLGCTFTQLHHASISSSASFTSCTFTYLTATVNGGAISLTSVDTFSIEQCLFTRCSKTVPINDYNGGVTVSSATGSKLSITQTSFIFCSSIAYGGGVYSKRGFTLCTVPSCSSVCFTSLRLNRG